MKNFEISKKRIYQPTFPTEDCNCYTYVRAIRGDEVAFSVLEEITDHPDFSNCGVFCVKKKDFRKLVRVVR